MLKFAFLYFIILLNINPLDASGTNPCHDYYLSLCEMDYNEKSNSLEISIRVFNDDLEKAVFNFNKGQIYDVYGKPTDESTNKIKEYLFSKFSVRFDNRAASTPEFVGWETQEGAIWSYLEIKNAGNFKSITVRNSLLMEIFERQKNLIYLKKNNTEKSVILVKDKAISTITI